MTPEQLAAARDLLHRVRHWRVSIERALDELDEISRGEVSPTTPDQGATLPGAPLRPVDVSIAAVRGVIDWPR